MLFRSNDTATTEIYTSVHTLPYTTLFRSIGQLVLNWMAKHCYGHAKAMKRADILAFLPISLSDRTLRSYLSELKHENHIASHPEKGYWFIPLHTNSAEEVYWVKRSWEDMRSKALSMLEDCSRNIKELSNRQAQGDLFKEDNETVNV